MRNWLQRETCRFSFGVLLVVAIVVVVPAAAFAQEEHRSSFAASTFKGVIFDPTTYAPALIAYDATMRDWNSSQPLFRSGYVELNERFTVSGLPRDVPVSYQIGNRRIVGDAFANLGMSVVNNVADRVFERILTDRFPTHRKVVRTLGWIERSAFASYMSYQLSAAHYRQASTNVRLAEQLGLR